MVSYSLIDMGMVFLVRGIIVKDFILEWGGNYI